MPGGVEIKLNSRTKYVEYKSTLEFELLRGYFYPQPSRIEDYKLSSLPALLITPVSSNGQNKFYPTYHSNNNNNKPSATAGRINPIGWPDLGRGP